MSYRLKIDPKSAKVSRFLSKVNRLIQSEFIKSGMTQKELAERIGADRSIVNRRLKSKSNLTSRSIAEFAFAFGKDIEIKFVDPAVRKGSNYERTPEGKYVVGSHDQANDSNDILHESAVSHSTSATFLVNKVSA